MAVISNTNQGRTLAKKLGQSFILLKEVVYPDSETAWTWSGKKSDWNIVYWQFNFKKGFDAQFFNLLAVLHHHQKNKTHLILPYLPYCRAYKVKLNEIQKFKFILAELDKLVTKLYLVQPHAPVLWLKKQLPHTKLVMVDIKESLVKLFKKKFKKYILVSPDKGSRTYVKILAKLANKEFIGFSKKRLSPTQVKIHLSVNDIKTVKDNLKQHFILVDDIIASGNTMLKAGQALKELGVKKISYFATHNTAQEETVRQLKVLTSNSLINDKYILDNTLDIYHSLEK